jgi:hypothetical protein
VIASGETERRALPHLTAGLRAEGISVDDVRIPPGNKALDAKMAERLVKAAWYEKIADPPAKFIVLVDADGRVPQEVLRPFRDELPGRLGPNVQATVLFAFAQWHLEAWYFADAAALRSYLGKALGSVDTATPDEIQKPKLHLKNLLEERVYTAVVSEEIAKTINAQTAAGRSPSFRGFLAAVRNGSAAAPQK